MSDSARPRITISDNEGRQVGVAVIHLVDETVFRASLHVEAGHLQPGTRARLVDAVLDAPEVSSCRRVQVTVPLGDTEMLDRFRERSATGQVRPAGASCLIDAELPGRSAR